MGLAIKIALDFGVSKKKIIKTIPKVKFQGRLQYVYTGKLKKLLKKNEKLLLDGCHTHQSAKNLLSYFKERDIKNIIYYSEKEKALLKDIMIFAFPNGIPDFKPEKPIENVKFSVPEIRKKPVVKEDDDLDIDDI